MSSFLVAMFDIIAWALVHKFIATAFYMAGLLVLRLKEDTLSSALQCCAVLCCAVLCCAVLCCAVLCCCTSLLKFVMLMHGRHRVVNFNSSSARAGQGERASARHNLRDPRLQACMLHAFSAALCLHYFMQLLCKCTCQCSLDAGNM